MAKKSIFIRFCATFIVLLILLMVTAGWAFNYYMLNYSEKEISNAIIGKLKLLKGINDLLSDSIKKDLLNLALDSSLNNIRGLNRYYSSNKNSEAISRLSKALDSLEELTKTNSMMHSVYLYLNSFDYVLTSNEGVVLKSNFKDTSWLDIYIKSKYEGASKNFMARRIIPNSGTLVNADNDASRPYVLTYIFPLIYITDLDGIIVANIYESALCDLINVSDMKTEGYIFAVDNRGNVVTHVDKSLLGKNLNKEDYIPDILKSKNTSGYLVADDDGKNRRNLIVFLKSDYNNWIYIGVFSMDSLMQRAYRLRLNIILILFGLMVFGGISAYIVFRKLYSPVNKLVYDIKTRKGFNFRENDNDMDILFKAFSTLTQQEDRFFEFVEKNKRTLRENYIKSLLAGNETNPDSFAPEDIFPFPCFICTIAVIDNYETFASRNKQEQQYYIKLLIQNICEEIINTGKDVTIRCNGVLQDENRIVLVINMKETSDENILALRDDFIRIQKEISKVLENTISVGIGSSHPGRKGVHISYNEALEALKYRLVYGYASIIMWENETQKEKDFFYPHARVKHILNYLNLGLKKEIISETEKLFEEIFRQRNLTYDNIMQIFNQFVAEIVRFLAEANININDVYTTSRNIYKELTRKETKDEIKEWLMKLLMDISDYMENAKNYKKCYINEIFEYIRQNYRKDISINMLADHVGISYSYVRKIFRDETKGKSITEYINSLRINEAKKLLKETRMNIGEIALNLGYNNEQSFCRNFKKIEGITPSEYKSISSS